MAILRSAKLAINSKMNMNEMQISLVKTFCECDF